MLLIILSSFVIACLGGLPFSALPPGYDSMLFTNNLQAPRQISLVPSTGDLLVLESGLNQITVLFDSDNSGTSSPNERVALVTWPGLNHGLTLYGNFIFASNETAVLRWEYSPSTRTLVSSQPVLFIDNIPPATDSSSWYQTRSLAIQTGCTEGCELFVHLGSGTNVELNDTRSQVRSFPLDAAPSQLPLDYSQGNLVGSGLRNAIGLSWQRSSSTLWAVESSAEGLSRPDIDPNAAENNPAEELVHFETEGAFYGFPFCWSEFLLNATFPSVPNRQWAWGSYMNATVTDLWCRNLTNNVPPKLSMQGHSSALGIIFYDFNDYEGKNLSPPSPVAFPSDSACKAFIAFHGSVDRLGTTGYKLVCITFDQNNVPTGYQDFFHFDLGEDQNTEWTYRPVEMAIGNMGELYFTSDLEDFGLVAKIIYNSTTDTPSTSHKQSNVLFFAFSSPLFLLFLLFVLPMH